MSNFFDKIKDRILPLVSLRHDYTHVFGTPEGQRVLRDICRMGFVTRTTVDPTDSKFFLNEGSRRLALAILSRAEQDPQAFISKYIKENDHE